MTIVRATDFASNENEQIQRCAQIIANPGAKRTLWLAVYRGKKAIKTVDELSQLPGLNYMKVLTAGKFLHDKWVLEQVKNGGRVVGFRKFQHLDKSKSLILSLAKNKARRQAFPTKRNPAGLSKIEIKLPKAQTSFTIDIAQITIADIDSFKKAARMKAVPTLKPNRLPEAQFKYGVAEILNNRGKFQDWGGEKNDLFSTQVSISGKRYACAIAFKGPATKGTLTPAKLGKNGDQIQRLLSSTAQVFLVQYEGEVAESVYEQMKRLAIGLSASEQTKVFYGVIAQEDSFRLRAAYKQAFKKAKKKSAK